MDYKTLAVLAMTEDLERMLDNIFHFTEFPPIAVEEELARATNHKWRVDRVYIPDDNSYNWIATTYWCGDKYGLRAKAGGVKELELVIVEAKRYMEALNKC